MTEDLSPGLLSFLRTPTAVRVLTIMLVLYWVALFCGTHMPMPQGLLPGNSDKSIHFVAYAGLGALLMARQASLGAILWPGILICWFVLAVYGIFDELTQLLVNRTADFHDWLYDISGAATGLVVVAVIVGWFRPKLPESLRA